MAISAAAMAAISAGLSAAGSVGGSYIQAGMNKRQMRYARELANKGLTQSDLQAFELNRQSVQEARDWELQMDSTNYQRKVADMQAAGVNPALAMDGVLSAPSSNMAATADSSGIQGALGVNAPDLSSVMQAAMLPGQLKNIATQNKLLEEEAESKRLDNIAKGTDIKYQEQRILLSMDEIQSKIESNTQVARVNSKTVEYLQKQINRYDEVTDASVAKMWSEVGLNDKQQSVAEATYRQIMTEVQWMPKVWAAGISANYAAAGKSAAETKFMRFDRMKQVTLKQARSMGVNLLGFGINGSTSDDTLVLICPTENGKSWDMVGFGNSDIKGAPESFTDDSDIQELIRSGQ